MLPSGAMMRLGYAGQNDDPFRSVERFRASRSETGGCGQRTSSEWFAAVGPEPSWETTPSLCFSSTESSRGCGTIRARSAHWACRSRRSDRSRWTRLTFRSERQCSLRRLRDATARASGHSAPDGRAGHWRSDPRSRTRRPFHGMGPGSGCAGHVYLAVNHDVWSYLALRKRWTWCAKWSAGRRPSGQALGPRRCRARHGGLPQPGPWCSCDPAAMVTINPGR